MVQIYAPDNVAKQVSQVTTQLPQYVIEDHAKFVDFLKAYYRWSSTEGPLAALNYMKYNNDVDFVMDSMLDGYTNLFAYNIPKDMKVDMRFFIKFLKSFYEVKGTDESYKILYRALFNEDVLVYYPSRNVFMTSSASWSSDKSFKITYDGDGFSLRGKRLTGENKGFKCLISDVVKQNDQWIIIYQNSTGDFIPNEKLAISGQDDYAYVVPVYEIASIDSKSRWYDNDIIKLENDLIIKVDKINYGYIEAITITNGGTGYEIGDEIFTESNYSGTGFKATVLSVDTDGAILTVTVNRTGFGYVNENVWFVGGSGTGFTAIPTWNADFRKIHTASIVLNRKKVSPSDETFVFGDNESIVMKSGVYTAPRYWKKIRGAPSTETARIHDSYYYQEFSYVLSSTAATADYDVALKKILQVAGLKLFIEQNVSQTVKAGFDSQIFLD